MLKNEIFSYSTVKISRPGQKFVTAVLNCQKLRFKINVLVQQKAQRLFRPNIKHVSQLSELQ